MKFQFSHLILHSISLIQITWRHDDSIQALIKHLIFISVNIQGQGEKFSV